MMRAALGAAVAAVVLVGCSSESPVDTGRTPSTTSSPQTVAHDDVQTCKLKGSVRGGVVVGVFEDEVRVSFDAQPVPLSGTLLYSMTGFDAAGEIGVQLGMKYVDGQQLPVFVFDFADAQQSEVTDAYLDVNGQVVAAFPLDDLGSASEAHLTSFTAAVSVNGTDVGTCKPKP